LSSLSAKAKDGVMLVLEELKIEQPKTREVYKILKNLKIDNKTLLISKRDKTLNIASRNIATLNVKDVTDLTAYDVIDADRIIFTKESLERCSMLSI